jgi:two-component system, OmpR family, phosphate regulon sensor histidine kinase PhoR
MTPMDRHNMTVAMTETRPPPESGEINLPDKGMVAVASRLADPCLIVDRQARLRYVNPVATQMFGAIEAGRPLSFLIRAPELSEAARAAVQTNAPQTITYFERVPVDRWFEARVSPIAVKDPGRPAPLLLIVLRDLTEAQRVERMRVDFIANVSHELRTPLASLLGFIETLQGAARNDRESRERFLDVMVQQARRMARLIDDLISLSRIELNAHVRPSTVVDLVSIIRHVADTMAPIARESGVELKLDIPETSLFVRGDQDELAQLFQNLMHNGIKYGHSGGRLEVSASRQFRPSGKPERISVAVRDYGPGIAEEHLPRLTERFYRVNVETSREKGGTGLGLAIVKHILNRHRGTLTIVSESGKGATFTVHLDAEQPQAEREPT